MISPSIDVKFEGTKPLTVLQDLIKKRQRWLHETYDDAVIATAITALQSIRVATRKRRKKEKVKLGSVRAEIRRRTDVHTGYRTKTHQRCYRAGERSMANKHAGTIDLGPHTVQLVEPGQRQWRKALVFHVTLAPEQAVRWPKQPVGFDVVALSIEAVQSYLEKRWGKVANRSAGLARWTLTDVMSKLSTRATKEEVSAAVKRTAERFEEIVITDGDWDYRVKVQVSLAYIFESIKGGEAGVETALKRAANRITAIVKRKAPADLKEQLSSPFPEVKRNRRKKK